MTEVLNKNPAEEAAEKAMKEIFKCLSQSESFLLEAGAGAGKTYSLIQALKYLVKERGESLISKGQKIACITYTNVACDEIKNRVDGHPAVLASTIHAFCWSIIKDFQSQLWEELLHIERWAEMIAESNIRNKIKIEYDLGYRSVDSEKISLGHDDVVSLTAKFMNYDKFIKILSSRYPVLFIDEYQDSDKDFIDSILTHIIDKKEQTLVGFFGDGWQKIYGNGSGSIENSNITYIDKHANFRSENAIVEALNKIRPDLKQAIKDPHSTGSVNVYHTNGWKGERQKGSHWKGDLPTEVAQRALEKVRLHLKEEWDFKPKKTKILMLTNNVLAREQGYSGIANVFRRSEDYLKKGNPYIDFFVSTLEPLSIAFENSRYGDMFKVLDRRSAIIQSTNDKTEWYEAMSSLIQLRATGTIGEVVSHLKDTRRPRLSAIMEKMEKKLEQYNPTCEEEKVSSMERIKQLKKVPYQEVVELARYIEEKTPFSTKHGVKGAEFENVLVVFGRGWNHYDFNRFLEYSVDIEKISIDQKDFYERNRNLFYVAVSRPMRRLTLLFTQELSNDSLSKLSEWFGDDNIYSMGDSILDEN
ncbi:DNA and RNA helicases [Bacillus sp. OxB-1]|uniref:UvrD-helicase domain-containing protein n=1 Tax=Bacillus sp. (strain OxB-1) TaxID=98228 RepID=UPI0005820A37|nr:UvrD-helicase domain-containing protein [Bacillus sp. OxB-1]BAQ09538.1 DNA and RNA helicases [Bacillus sp. OxB-1]